MIAVSNWPRSMPNAVSFQDGAKVNAVGSGGHSINLKRRRKATSRRLIDLSAVFIVPRTNRSGGIVRSTVGSCAVTKLRPRLSASMYVMSSPKTFATSARLISSMTSSVGPDSACFAAFNSTPGVRMNAAGSSGFGRNPWTKSS